MLKRMQYLYRLPEVCKLFLSGRSFKSLATLNVQFNPEKKDVSHYKS